MMCSDTLKYVHIVIRYSRTMLNDAIMLSPSKLLCSVNNIVVNFVSYFIFMQLVTFIIRLRAKRYNEIRTTTFYKRVPYPHRVKCEWADAVYVFNTAKIDYDSIKEADVGSKRDDGRIEVEYHTFCFLHT